LAHFFVKQGWPQEVIDPSEALLLEARQRVARQFGGVLPLNPGLGLPPQNEKAPLTRWLRGEGREYSSALSPQSFYDQVRKLLLGLEMEGAKVEELIEAAVFAEQGWMREASDPRDVLLLAARRAVAREYGGVLPHNPGLGLSPQSRKVPLTRWLWGERLEYSTNLRPQLFYDQVRKLLSGLGVEEAKVEEMIEAAVFTEQDWKRGASDPRKVLLLTARRAVARQFGGVLPANPGLGLPPQYRKAALTLWLKGEKKDVDENLLPQIRILLCEGSRTDSTEIESMITAALADQGTL
jgi:hypothetical protein